MKLIKEILCFPFFIITMMGLVLVITGVVLVEAIAGEKIKEVQVKLNNK